MENQLYAGDGILSGYLRRFSVKNVSIPSTVALTSLVKSNLHFLNLSLLQMRKRLGTCPLLHPYTQTTFATYNAFEYICS